MRAANYPKISTLLLGDFNYISLVGQRNRTFALNFNVQAKGYMTQ